MAWHGNEESIRQEYPLPNSFQIINLQLTSSLKYLTHKVFKYQLTNSQIIDFYLLCFECPVRAFQSSRAEMVQDNMCDFVKICFYILRKFWEKKIYIYIYIVFRISNMAWKYILNIIGKNFLPICFLNIVNMKCPGIVYTLYVTHTYTGL